MESLGNKLKTARETKGYTFDQVSQETHVSSRYLKALEIEDFAIFPGEPFLLGFLRNYGEFLGLDVQELISLYKAMKIQEEPVPMDKLVKTHSPFPFKLAFIVLTTIIILGGIGCAVYFFLINPNRKRPVAIITPRVPIEYTLSEGFIERRFYPGDTIIVPYEEAVYMLELVNIGEAVIISAPGREVILDLGQEVIVNLGSDNFEDLRIYVADFDKNGGNVGALLRFELDSIKPPEVIATGPGTSNTTSIIPQITPISNTGISNATLVFQSTSAYPFTLQAVFQGYCMFRWEVLSEAARQGRSERYHQRGDTLDITAQNGIRLWASNAAVVRLQVIGGGRTVPLELGGAGEVVVAEIRWVRDGENQFRLLLIKL